MKNLALKTLNRRWRFQFQLRTLLLVIFPVSIVIALAANAHRQNEIRNRAVSAACSKGLDLVNLNSDGYVLYFNSSNVTDKDLKDFMPGFVAKERFGNIAARCVDLNGSPVSDEAVKKFMREVPWCEVRR